MARATATFAAAVLIALVALASAHATDHTSVDIREIDVRLAEAGAIEFRIRYAEPVELPRSTVIDIFIDADGDLATGDEGFEYAIDYSRGIDGRACCGHAVYATTGRFSVLVVGCDAGRDLEIERSDDTVVVHAPDGSRLTVRATAWRQAVLGFCGAVEEFYARSEPKTPDDVEAEGWGAFWKEWRERVSAAS